MVKIATLLKVKLNVVPGFALASFPYNAHMLSGLKALPGCRWNEARHGWLIPNELAGAVSQLGVRNGMTPVIEPEKVNLFSRDAVNAKAYDFQRDDILRSLNIRRSMLAWEMGLGKTLGGIECMRLGGGKRILVVVPAMARSVWAKEIPKWWPNSPEVVPIETGKEAEDFTLAYGSESSWIAVVSYELLHKLRLPEKKLDHIIADESHYAKEPTVKRSKALNQVCAAQREDCFRTFLTGTPITVNPIDIWHQAECLYPGRLGNYYTFGDTYCGRIANPNRVRGYDYYGVNPVRAKELEERLASFVFRRTKGEVADQLPALVTQTIRIKAKRFKLRELTAALDRHDLHRADLESILMRAGSEKIDPIVEMVQADLEAGCTHVGLLTYFQLTAAELAGRLRDVLSVPVFNVDGTVPEKKRMAIIDEAKACPSAVFVSTMKAVNVGISLTKFCPGYFAELYSAPGIIAQAAGRFHRVGGEHATAIIRFPILEGSGEEAIADSLERRLRDFGKVVKRGHIDDAIVGALETDDTPEAYMKRIREATANAHEEDVYGG